MACQLLSLLIFAYLLESKPVEITLSYYMGHYTTNITIGDFNSMFCFDTQSPHTFAPLEGVSTTSYKCSSQSNCQYKGDSVSYSYEYDYRSGKSIEDHLSIQCKNPIIFNSFDFIGVTYQTLVYNFICESSFGLNYIQSGKSFEGMNKVIGLHLPSNIITLNGYHEEYVQGTILYYNLHTTAPTKGWYLDFNEFRIQNISYSPEIGSYIALNTNEAYIVVPLKYHNIFKENFCASKHCYYNNEELLTIDVNSTDVTGYGFGNIEIVISPEFIFNLTSQDYLRLENNTLILQLRVNSVDADRWIIGNMALSKYHIILDGDNERIGISNIRNVRKKDWSFLMISIVGLVLIGLISLCIICYKRIKKNSSKLVNTIQASIQKAPDPNMP